MAKIRKANEDFLIELKSENPDVGGFLIDIEVIIDATIINFDFKRFTNITFNDKVTIQNVDIKSGLEFINCQFNKGIHFENVKSTGFDTKINPDNFSVSFSGCTSPYIIFSEHCQFDRNIILKNHSKIGELKIFNTTVDSGKLYIKECLIEKGFDLSNCTFDIGISSSKITEEFRVESLIGNIALISSTFKGWVKFWNINSSISFTLNKNKFEDTFDIEASIINSFFIHGDSFERKATLENRDLQQSGKDASINEIYITEANFVEGFNFNGLDKSIKKITLKITPKFQGVLKFDGWQINHLLISGINKDLKLLFKRNSFEFFVFNDFSNYGDLSFDKCDAFGDSTLNLVDCDLGNARFNEFSFDTYKEIRIDNVTLDKIKLTNIKWFEEKALVHFPDEENKGNYKKRREFYRQLKQALKNNGNQIDSLIFQARELKSHRDELKNSTKYSIGDKIIMIISKTNDYGLNWMKPAIIVILITLLFYLLILPLLSNEIIYKINITTENISITWNEFINHINVLWQLFNPVRQIKLTYGDNIQSGWIYLFDLIHRLFLGIMIFQIIKAFRKFVSN